MAHAVRSFSSYSPLGRRKAFPRFLSSICLLAAAGLASAQCYQFSAPGITYSMNISSVTNGQTVLGVETAFIVQQVSTLTYGGKTYIASSGPGNVSIESQGGQSSFMSAALQSITAPPWQVNISLVGMVTLPINAPPASLPPISVWGQQAMLEASISGVLPATNLTITAIGSCSSSTGPGGSVPGQTLGDPSTQPGCAACGFPISVGTGNMFESAVDYRTFGANALAFTRYYNSLSAAATLAASLGKNWRSNYDRYLQISSGSVIAERPDGQQVTFSSTGGAWIPSTDMDLTLVNSGTTWTLTDHNDNVESYAATDSQGSLQTIQTRNGYTQTLQYNSNNQVTSVTDSFNRQLSFTYSNGLLQSVTTPDGLVLSYGYTTAGGSNLLSSVSYSTTPVTTKSYLYENSSLPLALTAIVDENGARYMSWTYDSQGRALTSQRGAGSDLISIAYNDSDGSRTVTGPLGQSGVYHFSTLQNVPKVTEIDFAATPTTAAAKMSFTYDSNGYVASRTDWNGNVTTMVNNSRGLPVSIVEASGTPQARTTTTAYHASFHLPVQIVRPAVTQSLSYDNIGELLTYTLTDTTTNTVPYATSGQTRTWTLTWANLQAASITGPRTDVSTIMKFAYDASGALTSITNALNQNLRVTAHLPSGFPGTIVDQNGVTSTLTYDSRQRLLTSTIATAAGPMTAKLAYDAAGNIVTFTMPDGSGYNNTYDSAHRLTAVTDSLHQSKNFTWNAADKITAMSLKDPSGNARLQHSGMYDSLGRAIQTIGGAGQTTSYGYDANSNLTMITDGLNHIRRQSFDVLNRLVQTTDAAQGSTTVTYDPSSRPATITDPNGATTQYTYDGFGDLIQEVSPISGTTIYRYDASGNLTERLDSRGVVTNYAYDALDRLISITYPGGSGENVSFTYDQNQFGTGRVTSVADAAGTLTRQYDERGNILMETRAQSGATLATAYAYDAASRIASITYPSHWSVTFTRDTMGRVISAAAASGTGPSRALFSSAGYQPFGPLNSLTYGNGIAETRTFDGDYRLTGMSATVQKLAYGYDATDNVLSIADGVQAGNTQSLAYDALSRLTGASGAYGKLGYTYDANGNRLTETSAAASDGLGTVSSFTYNQSGRLAAAYSGDRQLTQYTYDAFGRRLVKNGSTTGTTRYQYAADGALLEEADGQGNAQVDYVYLSHRPVATIEGDGTLHFLHDDRLGAPQLATDSSQAVAWSTTYQPFGQIANAPTLIANDVRLPGQEADAETGLYHNGFRDYAPGQGKYVQSDPAGLAGGMNRYTYAEGNPTGEIDPSGLSSSLVSRLSAAWQNAAQPCNEFGNCTTLSQLQIAVRLATAQQTPYVPTLPSDIGPFAPAPTLNVIPDMQCTNFGTCTAAALADVTAAAWQRINNYNSTFYSQVLVPTFQKTLGYAETAFGIAAGAPELGVAELAEVPQGVESGVSVLNFLFGSEEGNDTLYPTGNVPGMQGFNIPGGTGLGSLFATGAKDVAQGLQICPVTGQVVGGH